MSEVAAQAAVDEARGKSRMFVWTHKVEGSDGEVREEVLELVIPRKFKRLKFAKKAATGDVIGAFEIVFGPGALDLMEDWEMDAEEWDTFMERLGEAIAGTGNS